MVHPSLRQMELNKEFAERLNLKFTKRASVKQVTKITRKLKLSFKTRASFLTPLTRIVRFLRQSIGNIFKTFYKKYSKSLAI